jgi:hypothetical protein
MKGKTPLRTVVSRGMISSSKRTANFSTPLAT